MGAGFKTKVDNICGSYMYKNCYKIADICKEPVYMTFQWVEENRRRDIDNVVSAKKYILDAMQKLKLLPNDSPKYVREIFDLGVTYGNESKVIVKIYSHKEFEDYKNDIIDYVLSLDS